MVMLSGDFPSIVEPLLNEAFDGIYKEHPEQWPKVFKKTMAIKRSVHEEPVLYGLGNAQLKPTGTAIVEDAGGQTYTARYYFETYGLSFSLTEELIEDGEHISIGTLYAKYLARSMRNTRELVGANYLNAGFTALASGGTTVGDAVPLFSTAHPLASGGTESNTLATPASLSEAAIEQLLIQIAQFVDQRGLPMDISAECLALPPALEYVGTRILDTVLKNDTTDNAINAIRYLNRIPKGIQVMTRFTSSTAYFITTDVEQGLQYKERRALTRGMEPDFRTGNEQYKATMRFAFGETDWAGCWACQGA